MWFYCPVHSHLLNIYFDQIQIWSLCYDMWVSSLFSYYVHVNLLTYCQNHKIQLMKTLYAWEKISFSCCAAFDLSNLSLFLSKKRVMKWHKRTGKAPIIVQMNVSIWHGLVWLSHFLNDIMPTMFIKWLPFESVGAKMDWQQMVKGYDC